MDEKKFAEIVRDTKAAVLSSVRSHLAARFYHAIDDVVQETYIRAYRSLAKNIPGENPYIKTWLYTIAKNESLRMNDKLKREEMKFNRSVNKLDAEMKNHNPGIAADTECGMIDLRKTIKELPEKYRSVIELVAAGYSEKEIAEELNIKTGTVKSRASRGRELLKRMERGGSPI